MFQTVTILLDWFGLGIFAMTGALVASRKEMDITGFALLGFVTGVGGGTIRDLVLGRTPVFWVQEPAYVLVCLGVALLTFFFAHIPQSRYRFLLWLDAVGLSLFAVTGAERALEAGAGPVIAVTMGVATATFGGILRDLLGGESPVILRREIYITAALLGAATFVALGALGTPREVALGSGFGAAFLLRAAGLVWGLSLPRYRARPGRTPEGRD
ncbi:trimeric intracellular cation channel family protein [Cereibacter azotoformans]|uniref:trimeric intracellular cation channel family protein n=1 Tax=Cereibacter azotoformans TaxID=43057 RepID=UPI000C6E0E01|nr:trimeric intracellular cation channel family protein [Cereibacter azotoformans]